VHKLAGISASAQEQENWHNVSLETSLAFVLRGCLKLRYQQGDIFAEMCKEVVLNRRLRPTNM
jgi:hypothetical protein